MTLFHYDRWHGRNRVRVGRWEIRECWSDHGDGPFLWIDGDRYTREEVILKLETDDLLLGPVRAVLEEWVSSGRVREQE